MPPLRGARRRRAVVVGSLAALRSTALDRQRLTDLLEPAAPRASAVTTEEIAYALAVAGRALGALDRALGWLPTSGRPWRNSCLYRSVAQCAVLRHYGRAAHVALGAGRLDDDAVGAHAWVVYDGPEAVERPAADFVTFRPSAPGR